MKNVSKNLSVLFLGLVFFFALISTQPVEAKVPLSIDIEAAYMGGPFWVGEASTADGSHGAFTMILTEYEFKPNGQKGALIWRIDWDDGQYIEGTLKMTFVYETHGYGMDGGDVIANGIVTDASSDWAEWIGRHVHSMSEISPAPWVATGFLRLN